ncbi:MAG TPA: hypothetical protein ENN25_04985 [Euryarchaeota archaeon]|nr:hypothetical protein [Euryarchaeota archaeon]
MMSQVVQRVVTGTPGLDKMLHGGLWPGRLYLLIGPPGSGKTTLAVQFLLEGVKRGENVLLVALTSPRPRYGRTSDRFSARTSTRYAC